MVSRKRGRAEMEAPSPEPVKPSGLLTQLRNTWEFANIMQFIFIFGKVLKIDEDFDIEDLEDECMKPGPSQKLAEIGLCILKFISSHRGLTPELFDEHASRQYQRRAPDTNPFGDEEEPKKFLDFDVFTKLRVLCQLSRWVFIFSERLRERMPDTKDLEQLNWRMAEIGWDSNDRGYIVLDDNRLYRRTDPKPPPPLAPKPKAKAKAKPKAKANAKTFRAGTRTSKRRKTADQDEIQVEEEEEDVDATSPKEEQQEDKDPLEPKWECLAVTLQDYQDFLDGIKKSKDPNEKALHRAVTSDVLPVIEKREEDRQKKIARRQRELMNMEKMAHAKRSSRIANKHEKEQQETEARAAEEKRIADLAAAKKDAERQKQMEHARESRMQTREQRLKEREYKRILHEEELKNLEENSKKLEEGAGEGRLSERHLKAEMAKKQKALEELQEEEDWVFDCAKCGVHGENVDDGEHSVACEQCNVWQHSACLGVSKQDAEKDDFHFVCDDCKRREEDAKKPKIPALKFKVGASSPQSNTAYVKVPKLTEDSDTIQVESSKKRNLSDSQQHVPGMPPMKKWPPPVMPAPQPKVNGASLQNGVTNGASMQQSLMQGPTLIPQGQQATTYKVNGNSAVPPPGLQSPTRPSSKVDGAQSNGLPQMGVFSSSMQFLNGQSAKPMHPTLPAPSPNVGQRSSPPQSKPLQTPSSSFGTPAPTHRSSFTTPNNNGTTSFSKSPAQSPAYLNSPSTKLPPSSAAAPSLQPGFSPQKQMPSSPPPPAPSSPIQGASSPTIAPPASDSKAAGVSPLKRDSPRADKTSILENAPNILDNAPALASPSATQHPPPSPIKAQSP